MYITYLGACTMPKNSLEKAVRCYLSSIDRTLIDDVDLEDFKTRILDHIKNLNADYPRCRPLEPRFQEGRENDFLIGGIDGVSFHLFASKNTFKEGLIYLQTLV